MSAAGMMSSLPDTKEELLALRLEIQEQLDSIKGQVTEAKREFASGGVTSDRDWLNRAESALRHKGRTMQAIQAKLTTIKGAEVQRRSRQRRPDELQYVYRGDVVECPQCHADITRHHHRMDCSHRARVNQWCEGQEDTMVFSVAGELL